MKEFCRQILFPGRQLSSLRFERRGSRSSCSVGSAVGFCSAHLSLFDSFTDASASSLPADSLFADDEFWDVRYVRDHSLMVDLDYLWNDITSLLLCDRHLRTTIEDWILYNLGLHPDEDHFEDEELELADEVFSPNLEHNMKHHRARTIALCRVVVLDFLFHQHCSPLRHPSCVLFSPFFVASLFSGSVKFAFPYGPFFQEVLLIRWADFWVKNFREGLDYVGFEPAIRRMLEDVATQITPVIQIYEDVFTTHLSLLGFAFSSVFRRVFHQEEVYRIARCNENLMLTKLLHERCFLNFRREDLSMDEE